jgi:hypothetical protein
MTSYVYVYVIALNTSQRGYADTEGDIGYAPWIWLR